MNEDVAEALLRIKVIENILIKNNITSQKELSDELSKLFRLVAKEILGKAKVQGNLDKIIDALNTQEKD